MRCLAAVLVCSLAAGCFFDRSGIPATDLITRDGGEHDLSDTTIDQDAGVDAAGDLDAAADGARDIGPDLLPDHGPDLGPPITQLGPDDGRLWLGVGSAQLGLLSWSVSQSAWVTETNQPQPAGEVHWIVSHVFPATSPVSDLALLKVEVSGSPVLQAFSWSNGTWQQSLYIPGAGAELHRRDFALAVENSSTDQLVVYSDGSSRPLFITRSTGAWSAPAYLPINDGAGPGPDLTGGKLHWVELVPSGKQGSDEIALLFADDQSDLGALVWTGSTWGTGSAATLTTNLRNNSVSSTVIQRVFDGAFETKTGDLMVAWGDDTDDGFKYRVLPSGGGWSGVASATAPKNGIPNFVDLAADPASDKIAGAFVDLHGTEKLGLATWTGSGWVGADDYDTQIRKVDEQAHGDFTAAVAWVGSSGKAVCAYADDDKGKISWSSWSGSWTLGSDVGLSCNGETESVVLRSQAKQDRLLLVLSDDGKDLCSAAFDGTSWSVITKPAKLTTKLSRIDSLPFGLELRP